MKWEESFHVNLSASTSRAKHSIKCTIYLWGRRQQAVFRPGLHPPILSVCRVSPVEQCEDLTEEQLWSVLVRVLALTPVVLPFSSPGQSFKAAANQV